MVRMQADMAKPPEKRLNYKNSIDGLIRVRVADRKWLTIIETCTLDDSWRRIVFVDSRNGSQRVQSHLDECVSIGFVSIAAFFVRMTAYPDSQVRLLQSRAPPTRLPR